MKKTPLRIIAILITIFAVGCANFTAAGKTSPTIDRIQKRGALIVGTAANMPPLNMMTKSGLPSGLDVDLARSIRTVLDGGHPADIP